MRTEHRFIQWLALFAALVTCATGSFGLVACIEPDGHLTVDVVPAGQTTCLGCSTDVHAHHPSDGRSALDHAKAPCPCSDTVLTSGSPTTAPVAQASQVPVPAVLFVAASESFELATCRRPVLRVPRGPPRPPFLNIIVRSTVKLI